MTFIDETSQYYAMNKNTTPSATSETMTRKQRELFEREQLILDTAQQILREDGIQGLTMERVASEIEYSKGTVYNHFSSKEEIISGISCRCTLNIIEMFTRAKNYSGNHRERIAAIGIAHRLYAQLHPDELRNLQILKSADVREKIPEAKQTELLQLEQQVTRIVVEIINDALRDGDIPADQPFIPDSIFLGLWSMGYGSNMLHVSGIPFDKLGIQQPLKMMWVNSHKLLDSYQWQPLSTSFDTEALKEKIGNELFFEELKQLELLNQTP